MLTLPTIASVAPVEFDPAARTPQLQAAAREALGRALLAQNPSGVVHAADSVRERSCVPLFIDCNDAGFGTIDILDCSTDSGLFVDFVFFNGVVGNSVVATATSLDFDPFLVLFDPDVELVDSGGAVGSSTAVVNAVLNRTSPNWVLAVSPQRTYTFGDYLLTLDCTGTAPDPPPAAPSHLQATALTASSVRLTWQDNANDESSFRIEQKVSASFQEIGSVPANSTSAKVVGLNAGATYTFRVRARSAAGNSAYSNAATATTPTAPTSPCVPGSQVLCIDDQSGDRRFRITVDYQTSQGGGGGSAGAGKAISLAGEGVARGGLFSFFNPANPEMLIKVLDGCPVNGEHWVFYAATTNVGFTVTVTDTQTGAQWSRTNQDHLPAGPVQDTTAFGCD